MPKKKVSKNDTKKTKGKSVSKRKKSKENIEPEKIEIPKRPRIIREKKELIHDNPSQADEGIVKCIIDKIITLSIRNSHLNSINNKLDDYYFDNLKNQINTLFATNNIFYYDEPETEQLNKTELFWNKKYENNNTWIEILEPNTVKCDRYENSFMKYINLTYKSSAKLPSINGPTLTSANTIQGSDIINNKEEVRAILKKYTSVKMKNKELNNQILDTLEEKSSLSSVDEESKDTNNAFNKTKNSKKNSSKIMKKTPPKNAKSLFSYEINNQRTNFNNTNNINNGNKRPKKEPIPEMNNKEIPGIEKEYNYDKYDPPDINLLRKERQEEIFRKELEERKNVKSKKVINSNSQNDIIDSYIDTNTKVKFFDSNKYSFDSNGKIISFKPIKIDALTKDFASLQNGIKNQEKTTKVKRFIKKNKNKNTSTNKTDESKNKDSAVKKEKIIKNPEDDPNGINKHNYIKINTDKNDQIIPSGSNFSIMLPNIGVILKEDEQIKEGTREFGKYFKKYSLNDYDKILRDYVPLQNRTMLKNKMNQSMSNMNLNMTMTKKLSKNFMTNTNNSFKMNTNINLNNLSSGKNLFLSTPTQNYSQINNNADISNPLINQADTIQENEYNNSYNINNEFNLNNMNSINNSSLIKTIKSNNNISMHSSPFSLMKSTSYDNLPRFIKINKNGTSLKKELDSLKDLDDKTNLDFFPPSSKISIKTKNVFVNNYKDLISEKKKQIINDSKVKKNNFNEFNKKIILTKGWGTKTISNNMSTGNLLVSKHLTRYQALRELGSNLLNGIKVKLPRDRKVDVKI